ncbi:MAG: hypothetical protein H0W61_07375 [Bacteroidetes bacterium]|nr:hypothetical protein [Bacteroidota bacterium]
MAENKKSFVLYTDMLLTIEHLPDEVAGQLLKTVLLYVNDKNPEPTDILLKIAFEPIKQQLKRDLRKYEEKKKNWSDAGKASAASKKAKTEIQQTSTNVENVATESTVNVNDSVTVNVNDTSLKEKKTTNIIDVWMGDLPNSTHLETISRDLKIPIETLKTYIPEFRKTVSSEYMNQSKFIDHFKRLSRQIFDKNKTNPSKKRNQPL